MLSPSASDTRVLYFHVQLNIVNEYFVLLNSETLVPNRKRSMSRMYIVTLLIVAGGGWYILRINQNVKQTGSKQILLGKNGIDRPWGRVATKLPKRKKNHNTLKNDKMRDACMRLLSHWHHINHTDEKPMHIKNVEVCRKVFSCFYAFSAH